MIFGVYGPESTQTAFAVRALTRGAPPEVGGSVVDRLRRRCGRSRPAAEPHINEAPRPFGARLTCLVMMTWLLVGAPAGIASADACAYASVGPDGSQAVAVAGDLTWPTPPVCPVPTPTPPPPPAPTPRPTPPEPKPPPPAPAPPPKPMPT